MKAILLNRSRFGAAMKANLRKQLRGNTLYFSQKEIQDIANSRLRYINLSHAFLLQSWTENRLRFQKKVNFRKGQEGQGGGACQAYSEMNLQEFEGINARQKWANWR